METLRHLDGFGQSIVGPAVYVTAIGMFTLGGGRIASPGQVMVVEKARSIAWIFSKHVRESTPEEIALFEAERMRDAAALADARAGDDEASRALAEQAFEEEVERRVADRIAAQGLEGAELEAEIQRRIDAALEKDRAERGEQPATDPGAVTTRDPQTMTRDPKPSGTGRRGGS